MRSLLTVALGVAILLPATAQAKPEVCGKKNVIQTLENNGKPINAGIAQLFCADVTGDGRSDAVFSIDSGGTMGANAFGVLEGPASSLLLYRGGYGVALDVVNDRRFDVENPVYEGDDPNCCPSAYAYRAFTFSGDSFKAGRSHRYKKAKQRFMG